MKHIVQKEHLLAYIKFMLNGTLVQSHPEIEFGWKTIENLVRYQALYCNVKMFDLGELGVNVDAFYEWFFETNPDV